MKLIILCILIVSTQAFLGNYITGIKNYFRISDQEENENSDIFLRKVPYEVSAIDEKFISEAAKLTGVILSELDSCQHRVVLKLQTDCNKMNDEQLAKMAVQLLNCQSFVEGRKIFPCSAEMSIKECTTTMDADTWTSYHLMTNRVRAVCYSIRQTQFRGLAEHTVNRLMEAAKDQLKMLLSISEHQNSLKKLTETTYETITKDHDVLIKQQKDIQKAQFHGQLVIEDNIKRLEDEKLLILQAHNQLVDMTSIIHNQLEDSVKQLEVQTAENRVNHKELIEDLMNIQSKTKDIVKKIDESSTLLVKQNEDFKYQYEATLKNLQEVNRTVHSLVALVGGTRQALEEKLSWITSALGGTDFALERIYLILWHALYTLIAMLVCAFLSVNCYTRLMVATLPPANLAIALHNEQEHFNPLALTGVLLVLILIQTFLVTALNWRHEKQKKIPISSLPQKVNTTILNDSLEKYSEKSFVTSTNDMEELYNHSERHHMSDFSTSKFELDNGHEKNHLDENDDSFNLTPPASRIGYYSSRSRSRSNTPFRLNTSLRSNCNAKTRLGTPCKLTAVNGRDFCYRHQTGDSVMG